MKTNIKKLIESIKKLSNKDLNELLSRLNEDNGGNKKLNMDSFLKFWEGKDITKYIGSPGSTADVLETDGENWDIVNYSQNSHTPGWQQVYGFTNDQDIANMDTFPYESIVIHVNSIDKKNYMELYNKLKSYADLDGDIHFNEEGLDGDYLNLLEKNNISDDEKYYMENYDIVVRYFDAQWLAEEEYVSMIQAVEDYFIEEGRLSKKYEEENLID